MKCNRGHLFEIEGTYSKVSSQELNYLRCCECVACDSGAAHVLCFGCFIKQLNGLGNIWLG